MASTIAKVNISFGLVSVPVKVTVAARGESVSFNMLHEDCKHRVNMKTWCSHCDKEISRSQTLKGREMPDGSMVVIDPDELKALEPRSTKVLEITSTCSLSEIDPLLFDASYYLEADKGGAKGFALLVAALKKSKRAAIAKITMHQREHVVIIRPVAGGLMFHTMFYSEEIREAPEVTNEKVNPAELDLAVKLLEVNAQPFDHAAYKNEYNVAVEEMVAAKSSKQPVLITSRKEAPVKQGDLMEQMRAMLAAAEEGKKKKSA